MKKQNKIGCNCRCICNSPFPRGKTVYADCIHCEPTQKPTVLCHCHKDYCEDCKNLCFLCYENGKDGKHLNNEFCSQKPNKGDMRVTCASLDCPERKSWCCNAISDIYPTSYGSQFVCSKCGREFRGGECDAVKENHITDIGNKVDPVEDWEDEFDNFWVRTDTCGTCGAPYPDQVEDFISQLLSKAKQEGVKEGKAIIGDLYEEAHRVARDEALEEVKGKIEKMIVNPDEDPLAYCSGGNMYNFGLRDALNLLENKDPMIYPHAFGCEKFDDGECNCGFESYTIKAFKELKK